MRTLKVCFIITDAISYEMLCHGQFEYFKENSDLELTFVSGGEKKDFNTLENRKVGEIFDAKLVRKPDIVKDIKSLLILSTYLSVNRFDLVVYSTPKAMLLGSIASFITRHKNTVAIVRGRAYENYTGNKRSAYQLLDKVSLLASRNVIFISQSLKDAYLKEGLVNASKAHVLGNGSSNGVATNKFKPSEDSSEHRLLASTPRKSKKPFTVLIAGRICADKGLYDLEDIIKATDSNINYRLVGQVEGEDSKDFLQFLMRSYSNIEHIDYTTNIAEHFRTADLHLFLTHREGFGNVAIEAASCGIPTFAYDVIGVKDSVKIGVSGKKFKFKDTSSIAFAINEAANTPNLKEKYADARKWAIENFSQKNVWNNYLSFYKELLYKL